MGVSKSSRPCSTIIGHEDDDAVNNALETMHRCHYTAECRRRRTHSHSTGSAMTEHLAALAGLNCKSRVGDAFKSRRDSTGVSFRPYFISFLGISVCSPWASGVLPLVSLAF